MILGCVADDFTGASDAASFLQAGGANVILSNGIPEREDEDILEAQAVISTENQNLSSRRGGGPEYGCIFLAEGPWGRYAVF